MVHALPLDPSPVARVACLAPLSEGQVTEVSTFSRLAHLPPGELLFRRHQPCAALHVVMEGQVKLSVRAPGGKEQTLELCGPGQGLSEAALFSGQGYSSDARTLTDTRLLVIDAFRLTRFLRREPDALWNLVCSLSGRQHRLAEMAARLGSYNARQKVAAYLLERIDPNAEEPCWTLETPERAEWARHLAVTPETLCRVLTELRRDALIAAKGTQLTVRDADGLREAVGAPVAARADGPEGTRAGAPIAGGEAVRHRA